MYINKVNERIPQAESLVKSVSHNCGLQLKQLAKHGQTDLLLQIKEGVITPARAMRIFASRKAGWILVESGEALARLIEQKMDVVNALRLGQEVTILSERGKVVKLWRHPRYDEIAITSPRATRSKVLFTWGRDYSRISGGGCWKPVSDFSWKVQQFWDAL